MVLRTLAPFTTAALRTERLELRPPTEADRAVFVKWQLENARFLERFSPPPPMEGVTDSVAIAEEQFSRMLQRGTDGPVKGTGAVWLMWSHTGDLVGWLALSDIVRGVAQRTNIGYRLGERFIRQGLMTEAVNAVVGWALSSEGLGLHRVECAVQPENVASLGVARRAGFVQEGFFPKFLYIGGAWQDHIILAKRAE